MDYLSPLWTLSLPSLCFTSCGVCWVWKCVTVVYCWDGGNIVGDNVHYRYHQYQYVINVPLWIMYPQFKPTPFHHYISTSWGIYWVWKCITLAYCWDGGPLWGIMFIINSTNISASYIFDWGLRISSLKTIPSITIFYPVGYPLSVEMYHSGVQPRWGDTFGG